VQGLGTRFQSAPFPHRPSVVVSSFRGLDPALAAFAYEPTRPRTQLLKLVQSQGLAPTFDPLPWAPSLLWSPRSPFAHCEPAASSSIVRKTSSLLPFPHYFLTALPNPHAIVSIFVKNRWVRDYKLARLARLTRYAQQAGSNDELDPLELRRLKRIHVLVQARLLYVHTTMRIRRKDWRSMGTVGKIHLALIASG
jgi:hypothetical protein